METVPDKLTRARDQIEEAANTLKGVSVDLGQPFGATPLNIAVTHLGLAIARIKERLGEGREHAAK